MDNQEKNVQKIVLDIKDLIIIGLILFGIWMYFNPFNKSKVSELDDDNSKKDKQLQGIELVRDSLKKERQKFDLRLDSLRNVSKIRRDSINSLYRESLKKQNEIKDLREDLTQFNDMVERQSRKISELEKNPILVPKNKIVEKTSGQL
jgi:peptidoglycan hydrolase CwlO-like protein